ncbi:hypothetical protein [Urbifossiella limnaea]|uniref:Uncharacterized protein n=1 Tax=Urbifossiella limnaea TaxID=2528023 RepID=A0A517Y3K1_9BACT|nr:hypothetical protein [Urbifossiella limnaea]QDU24298.1 hypothetical protein ETAA1_63120 [Urbifossiella limnaea]
MPRLLRRLWADDTAAVISTELVLVLAILVFGLVPGLVALRNSGIAALTSLANIVRVIFPSVTFSQVNPGNGNGNGNGTGNGIGNGYVLVFNPNTNIVPYTAAAVMPTVVTVNAVAPAP